jgi:redox-sensing transcriptional repressor
MKRNTPIHSIERLCSLYNLVEQLEANGTDKVSSMELGNQLGVNANSIRRDISYLGEIGNCRAGYSLKKLKESLIQNLNITKKRTACIIGLGRLGNAILKYERLSQNGFKVVAGFDTNINKIETIQTKIPLYPASEIASIVRREGIELGVIAVPAEAAAETARRLMDGGIRGIVNFSAVVLKPGKGVFFRHIHLVSELRVISVVCDQDAPWKHPEGCTQD